MLHTQRWAVVRSFGLVALGYVLCLLFMWPYIKPDCEGKAADTTANEQVRSASLDEMKRTSNKAQSSSSTADTKHNSSEVHSQLVEGFIKAGGIMGPLELASFSYGNRSVRGYRAMSDIKKGDIVLSAPLSTILSGRVARASKIGWVFELDVLAHVDSSRHMVIYLMWAEQELQKADHGLGFFGLYAALLAEMDIPSVAATWMHAEVADMVVECGDSSLIQRVADDLVNVRSEYEQLFTGPGGLITRASQIFWDRNYYSLARFDKYATLVDSRQWRRQLLGHTGIVPFMMPVVDMLNSGNAGDCVLDGHKSDRTHADMMVMTAGRVFKKGEEVTYFYGHECRANSLITYGFWNEHQSTCQMKL